jgi:hypothetical protein
MRSLIFIVFAALIAACSESSKPLYAVHVDRSVTKSNYPTAVAPGVVGNYPGETKSGAGYFYDDVLEYRVWVSPKRGGKPLAEGSDYFAAFAQFESALKFAKSTPGAEEEPLALIRQFEWVNEPQDGKFEVERGERATEWRVEWLNGSKRGPNSIRDFLANPPKAP